MLAAFFRPSRLCAVPVHSSGFPRTLSALSALRSKDVTHSEPSRASPIRLGDELFERDDFSNVTANIVSKFNRRLLDRKKHPLNLLKLRTVEYFQKNHVRRFGNPLFTIFENISPIVTPKQNFDSLLVPQEHVSRSPKDTYYLNRENLLRCHTTAHDAELIKMGADAFLIFGDVFRRDAIDSTHYPVFHQADGVRLYSEKELFARAKDPHGTLRLFETAGVRTEDRQETHTLETAKMLEFELKATLEGLARSLFGPNVVFRWVDAYFPFTHPSWEMEVLFQGEWVEMLGCGVLEQHILNEAGALDKVAWAFGLGMERWAMRLYSIPDIRVFWNDDPGISCQFQVKDIHDSVDFKPVSLFPPCIADMSFWLPSEPGSRGVFSENDFYDLVRSVGGDQVEQVNLVDDFLHPKSQRRSHCYRIIYRDMSRTLTQTEVNNLHEQIATAAAQTLGVEIR